MGASRIIDIDVAIEETGGRRGGGAQGPPVAFRYRSDSGAVNADGTIDLRKVQAGDVTLRFNLVDEEAAFLPASTFWLLKVPRDAPKGPPACPDRKRAYRSFPAIRRKRPRTLEVDDANADHARYAYALRCTYRGRKVMHDPVIINQ